MSSPPSSAKIWGIDELTSLILSNLDQRSLGRSARVCKDWAELALDLLWRDVDDLPRLLNILCPLSKSEKATLQQGSTVYLYKFRRRITAGDWDNFQRYTKRVRRLVYCQKSGKLWRKLLDHTVFTELVKSCPTPAVLPNLHTLVWHAECGKKQMYSLPFTHDRLKHLDVQLHQPEQPFAPYLQQIARRSPEVTHLTLHFLSSARIFEDEITSFLPRLRRLQKLTLPLYGLTSRVVQELSQSPDLQEISLSIPTEFGNGDRTDVMAFSPVLRPGAFPLIQRLSFSSILQDATRFLQDPHFPTQIFSLYVHVLTIVEPSIIREFFTTVIHRCPALTELHVDFMICPDSALTVPGPPLHERPDISTFRPLFACRRLTSFEFRWDYALNLTDDDMHEFATSWPALEHLHLHCEPVIEFTLPALTLQALLPFAQHCPNLRTLGLYMDTTVPPPTDHSASASSPITPFPALTQLFVGASAITSIDTAALFLSQLLTPRCSLVTGVRWPDAYGVALDDAGIFDERRARMCEFWVRWNELAKVLPLVIRARAAERARAAGVLRELEARVRAGRAEALRCERLQREVVALQLRCGSIQVSASAAAER